MREIFGVEVCMNSTEYNKEKLTRICDTRMWRLSLTMAHLLDARIFWYGTLLSTIPLIPEPGVAALWPRRLVSWGFLWRGACAAYCSARYLLILVGRHSANTVCRLGKYASRYVQLCIWIPIYNHTISRQWKWFARTSQVKDVWTS